MGKTAHKLDADARAFMGFRTGEDVEGERQQRVTRENGRCLVILAMC